MRSFPVPGNGLMLTTNAIAEEFAASVVEEMLNGESEESKDV